MKYSSMAKVQEGSMVRSLTCGAIALLTVVTVQAQQQPARPMSPEGSAHAQVLGKWSKGERPSFAAGRET